MELALYAHPFDLEALAGHGGLSRVRDLGVGEITLATSYHDGRWLMPWHPDGRVRFLEDGTVHFRPGSGYGDLRPQASTSVPPSGPSPLERLCAEAPRFGLRVRAWNVFLHNSRLGAAHPELCVENAFGDRYSYALCPAQPAVQQYVLAMVRDLAAHRGLGSIEFEALGWMGWKHSSHHDKASFTPRGLLDYALSVCFCTACETRIRDAGGSPERSRTWARDLVRTAIEQADAMAPPAVPDRVDPVKWEAGDPVHRAAEDATWSVRSARIGVLGELGRAIQQALPATLTRAVQVHPNPLFTGSQLPVVQTEGLLADEHVITAYGEGPAAIGTLLGSGGMLPSDQGRKRLSIWPKAPQFGSDEDLIKVRALAESHGIKTIAVYHLGLLPWRTLERVARVLTA